MGFGDVRLAGLLGLVAARVDWGAFAFAFALGLTGAAVYGLASRVLTRATSRHREQMPIGPFLLAGALLGLLA